MSKKEFLRVLEETLNLSLDSDCVQEQIEYYEVYFSEEIKKGRSENEIIEELGDPKLIAKTIKTVNKNSSLEYQVNNEENYYNYGNNNYENDNYNESYTNRNNNRYQPIFFKNFNISCIIFLLVLFIILMAILKFLGYALVGVSTLLFGFGPIGILIVIFAIYFLFKRR